MFWKWKIEMPLVNKWIVMVMTLMTTRQRSWSWMLLVPCVDVLLSAALPHPTGVHRPPHPLWVITQRSGGQPGKCTASPSQLYDSVSPSCQNRNERQSISGITSSWLLRINGPLALINAAPVTLQYGQCCQKLYKRRPLKVFYPTQRSSFPFCPNRESHNVN